MFLIPVGLLTCASDVPGSAFSGFPNDRLSADEPDTSALTAPFPRGALHPIPFLSSGTDLRCP